MGQHVKVQAEGRRFSETGRAIPELDEAVTRVSIVPVDQRNQLQARVMRLKMPGYGVAEIALPNIQDETDGPVHMRR